ncbi:LOW QUALITY PROTEIN: steroid receptor-associated and regulated protein-like [Molossus nigricans]
MGLETHLDTSSVGKPAHHQKAIPTAHLTFIINCAHGKQLSLAASPVLPQAPKPNLGPVTLPMNSYILFCGDSQYHLIQEAPLGGTHLAQPARGTLPPCRGTVAPVFSLVSPLCPQETPEAKGSPLKMVPTRCTSWGTVMGLL